LAYGLQGFIGGVFEAKSHGRANIPFGEFTAEVSPFTSDEPRGIAKFSGYGVVDVF
jgi:hypothetical protein